MEGDGSMTDPVYSRLELLYVFAVRRRQMLFNVADLGKFLERKP